MASSQHRLQRHSSPSKQPNLGFAAVPSGFTSPRVTASKSGDRNPNSSSLPIKPAPEDVYLSNSSHLTREEVIRRRLHNLNQLTKVYSTHYWAMMEEIRAKHREYIWKFGRSPFRVEQEKEKEKEKEVSHDAVEANALCAFHGCSLKAMALTRFCHLHILSDPKQVLYKPCEYVIKSAQAGPITCGRPILRARVPAFCNVHLQKAQRLLKKAGLHASSSSKVAPRFHVIVAECVHQIQAKRRASLKENGDSVMVEEENCD
ncbi:uncharacterized protein LOC127811902 [Diospyros lotus]|uniref:uncharacterized protein LOC127811902 n=1 Tax=Diospyros lotus TaxID=55363 RepID=UPI00225B78D8|nr:uncharacterized protein LOC127811902 [Diospyros lotus]XP_052208055.1 uncharacterized protein LOC127811902 [Diospyros lotus]XP_052208057.1 uncharacterized protein LOC127811902 [Diospyros lotus]XP_052208058.1 uncharacterized protein LOC127811902 [Diospyros lotus]